MGRRSWRKRRRHDAEEMNITAFMNLMVALVPFLLITAVFSRMSILELNLPGAQASAAEPPQPELALEITVREGVIEIGDRNAGLLRRIDAGPDGYDLDALSEYLAGVKRSFPDKADATLLLEPDISYDVVVAVMDRMRELERIDESTQRVVKAELFPDIAIGDATLAAAGSR